MGSGQILYEPHISAELFPTLSLTLGTLEADISQESEDLELVYNN